MTAMTRAERTTLGKIAAQRARAAKASVAHRKAQLLADYEEQSCALYAAQDASWAAVVAEGKAAIARANARIRQVCQERGIPAEMAPSVGTYWSRRGVEDPKRRAELRKLAERQIDAAAREALAQIDAAEADVQVELLAGTLDSSEARLFLERIPTPDRLMPALRLEELEAQLPRRAGGYRAVTG